MTRASAESFLLGASAAMQRLRAQIARFGPTRLPALVQGPTGSGKELVARALHGASGRGGALVAFNVCALSEPMFEDALFGHVRGAFTGATAERRGYLAEANGGTVFLDEIGATAAGAQSKLLRAIETGSFRPVGASTDRVSDFRVVAASNEPLDELTRDGRFRCDLLHRLAGVTLHVPALRDRLDDVAILAGHFLAACPDGTTLTSEALMRLREWDWPGNVRELKHTIERASVMAEGRSIEREHVDQALNNMINVTPPALVVADSAERRELVRALLETSWDTSAAAAALGVHRATV